MKSKDKLKKVKKKISFKLKKKVNIVVIKY